MSYIRRIEDDLINFIKKYTFEILFGITVIISLLIRVRFLDFQSDDYNTFLARWFIKIKQNGGIFALKTSIGNYNIPYLVIMAIITYLPINELIAIKFVSIVFDYVMAIVSMLIVYELFKTNKNKHLYGLITFIIVSLLPTAILNSSAWAQCDSIYTSFVLLSILYLLKEKNIKAFIFLGIAFSFKLQTIFSLPIFILVYLSKRNFSILNFLIIPLTNLIMCLPAIIVGRNVIECFSVYLSQTTEYSGYIAMNFPSIYAIFLKPIGGSNLISNPSIAISKMGTLMLFMCFIIIGIIFIYKNIKLNNKLIIEILLWSIMFITFVLPHMHDRYLFMADVISIIYLILEPKKFYIPLVVNLISLYTYIEYLYAVHIIPIYIVTIIFGIIIMIMTREVILDLKKYNKELA